MATSRARALAGTCLVAVGLAGCRDSRAPRPAEPPVIASGASAAQGEQERGWLLSGGGREVYAVRRDTQGAHAAWLLEPVGDTSNRYGTWMRSIDAAPYRGKRVRITATLRTEGATQRVDFWARAQAKDSPGDGSGLGAAAEDLPADLDWRPDELVLDVPPETYLLQYGIGVAGPGRMWIEGAKVEVVEASVPLTNDRSHGSGGAHGSVVMGSGPLRGWLLAGNAPRDYEILADEATKHNGKTSGALRSLRATTGGFGTLMQAFSPETYRGKRLRLSAFIKADGVADWAGLWMRVDGPSGQRAIAFDNMQDRPIKGTRDWTKYDVVLDVAREASNIAFGVLLHGGGEVWIDDASFQVVDVSVPTTGSKHSAPENLRFEH